MSVSNLLNYNKYELYSDSITFNRNATIPNPTVNTLWVNTAGDLFLGATNISGATGTVTSVSAGAGLQALPSNPIVASGQISIPNSGVTAGSYTNSSITVNNLGIVTAASSGSAPAALEQSVYQGAATIDPVTSTPTPIITYDTPIIANAAFNATTGIYTVPVNGVYQISYVVPVLPSADAVIVSNSVILQVDGSTNLILMSMSSPPSTSQEVVMSGVVVLQFDNGTTLNLAVTDTSDEGAVPLSRNYQFSILQIA